MAVPAETDSSLKSAGMALVAEVSLIVMPRPLSVKAARAGIVNGRIGSAYAIKVRVTSTTRASWVVGIMTGGAVFHVGSRRLAVFRAPGQG